MVWSTTVPAITAAFLGSLVEVVEAFTIVLAVALTRGWRPALIGSALALALLVLIVLIFGPALALVPISLLQFVVGVLLILFGMRWLRKAILRSAGWIALHDEAAEFDKETRLLSSFSADKRADYLAGLAAFKAVLLEGIEVVFIVIAVGTAQGGRDTFAVLDKTVEGRRQMHQGCPFFGPNICHAASNSISWVCEG